MMEMTSVVEKIKHGRQGAARISFPEIEMSTRRLRGVYVGSGVRFVPWRNKFYFFNGNGTLWCTFIRCETKFKSVTRTRDLYIGINCKYRGCVKRIHNPDGGHSSMSCLASGYAPHEDVINIQNLSNLALNVSVI